MKRGGKGEHAPVIDDKRFSKLHTDPRFQRIPKAKSQVSIDSRFSKMFTDKNFTPKFKVDKRGRKSEKKTGENLSKYYKLPQKGRDEEGVEEKHVEEEAEEEEDEGELEVRGGVKEEAKERRVKAGRTNGRQREKDMLETVERQVEKALGKEEGGDDEEYAEEETEEKHGLGLSDSEDEQSAPSSSESSSSSSDDESETEEIVEEEVEEKIETTHEATNRLAIVNLDWDHMRAMDILVLLRSFIPKSGSIESVTVYPSDFGLQQMKEESEKGPVALFSAKKEKEQTDGLAVKAEEGEGEEGDEGEEEEEEEEEQKDEETVNNELRKYEKGRLRYYFAVVVCDSTSTANALYNECDGLEFERSSNTLDLRFIPESMEFGKDREARDSVSDVVGEYEAPDFTTRALQHSRVKLTWDDDEPTRVKALRRRLTADQLNEMNFKDYIASGSEGDSDSEERSEEEDEKVVEAAVSDPIEVETAPKISKEEKRAAMRAKYRALLLGSSKEKEEKEEQHGKLGGQGNMEEDMEITFTTGLSDLSDKLEQKRKEKQQKEKETVFESFLRTRKEKLRERKAKKGQQIEGETEGGDLYGVVEGEEKEDPFFKQDADVFSDPFFADGEDADEKHSKQKLAQNEENVSETRLKFGGKFSEEERLRRKKEMEAEKEEEEKKKAELELLLMDENGEGGKVKGFNLKAAKKKEKIGKKGKKSREGDDEAEDEEKGTTMDFEDPRFARLFDSPLFAIDPTNPQFRKSTGQLSILAEKQRRILNKDPTEEQGQLNNQNGSSAQNSMKSVSREKAELSSMVKSLKRKAEAQRTTTAAVALSKGKKRK